MLFKLLFGDDLNIETTLKCQMLFSKLLFLHFRWGMPHCKTNKKTRSPRKSYPTLRPLSQTLCFYLSRQRTDQKFFPRQRKPGGSRRKSWRKLIVTEKFAERSDRVPIVFQHPPVIPCEDRCEFGPPKGRTKKEVFVGPWTPILRRYDWKTRVYYFEPSFVSLPSWPRHLEKTLCTIFVRQLDCWF